MYSNNVNISLEGEIENQLQNDVTRFQLLHNITTSDRWLINTNIRGFEIGPIKRCEYLFNYGSVCSIDCPSYNTEL